MRSMRFVLVGVFIFSVFILSGRASAALPTPLEVGYLDFQFPSSLGNNEVTAEKPESKLWWNDGFWWASMWSTSGDAYHIFKLNWTTQEWVDTATALDDRKESRADVLWDGSKLYVVSHIWSGSASSASAGQRGELFRYSYSSGTYTLDAGFPVEVTGGDSEALVIDKDSTGMLWVTYVQDSKVYVNHSVVGDDASWVGPYVLPVGTDANVNSDDLSAVIAYDGHIGVMWSSQSSGNKMFFAAHADGADDQTWQSVGAYTTSGDDHINLKSLSSDGAGKVFAAVKTSRSDALLLVLVCNGDDCASASNWSAHTAYTGSDGNSPTRPALLLDTSNRDLFLFARVDDDIYYKRSDMDSVSFPGGPGEPFIKSSTNAINDPTTTKQNVNSTTGLVVMASDSSARYYFHNCIRLAGGTSPQCLTGNPIPEVHFSSPSYQISEDGAPTAEVTVELTGSVAGAVTVDYAVTAGNATSGQDFTAVPNGKITFPAGSTTPQIISIPILEDTIPELSETINLTLSNLIGTGVSLGTQNTAILTILDDDAPPTIQFSSATYSVIENAIQATIDVTLSNSSDTPVTVNYKTADGTAVAGSDYVAIPSTPLTFNPGDPLSKSYNVTLINTPDGEPDETVLLSLTNPSANASLGVPNTATLTIVDDVPPEVAFDSATYDVIEDVGLATINIVLSRPFATVVSVYFQTTAGGTATPGSDYTAVPLTQLLFQPGEVSKPVTVAIIDDDIKDVSAAETVLLNLSSPSTNASLGQSAATLTIFDNDIPPGIAFSSPTYSVSENGISATINVKLSHAYDTAVSVTYQTANGSASAGSDYTAIPATTMTFAPGDISKNFNVEINNDTTTEPSETVQLNLSNPSANAFLGAPSTATLTILDDDEDDLPPTVSFVETSYTVAENQGQVTITAKLSRPISEPYTVEYATADGTANAGEDYESASGQFTFLPDQTSKNFTVTILNNGENEQDEMFSLSLSDTNPTPLSMAARATVTISDDDRPTVQFSHSNYAAYGVGMFKIEVALNTPAAATTTVKFETSDGSAVAGSDYTAVQGTLVFEPGSTRQAFTIPILVSDSNATGKTINLTLSGPYKADLGLPDTAVLEILEGATLFLSLVRG